MSQKVEENKCVPNGHKFSGKCKHSDSRLSPCFCNSPIDTPLSVTVETWPLLSVRFFYRTRQNLYFLHMTQVLEKRVFSTDSTKALNLSRRSTAFLRLAELGFLLNRPSSHPDDPVGGGFNPT